MEEILMQGGKLQEYYHSKMLHGGALDQPAYKKECVQVQNEKCLAQFIRGCILYCTIKISNENQGLYHSLPIPTRPYESISINFVGGFPRTKKGRNYLFLAVDKFSKMYIHMPCKRTIKGPYTINILCRNGRYAFTPKQLSRYMQHI